MQIFRDTGGVNTSLAEYHAGHGEVAGAEGVEGDDRNHD
jgi:hypothetical protein